MINLDPRAGSKCEVLCVLPFLPPEACPQGIPLKIYLDCIHPLLHSCLPPSSTITLLSPLRPTVTSQNAVKELVGNCQHLQMCCLKHCDWHICQHLASGTFPCCWHSLTPSIFSCISYFYTFYIHLHKIRQEQCSWFSEIKQQK